MATGSASKDFSLFFLLEFMMFVGDVTWATMWSVFSLDPFSTFCMVVTDRLVASGSTSTDFSRFFLLELVFNACVVSCVSGATTDNDFSSWSFLIPFSAFSAVVIFRPIAYDSASIKFVHIFFLELSFCVGVMVGALRVTTGLIDSSEDDFLSFFSSYLFFSFSKVIDVSLVIVSSFTRFSFFFLFFLEVAGVSLTVIFMVDADSLVDMAGVITFFEGVARDTRCFRVLRVANGENSSLTLSVSLFDSKSLAFSSRVSFSVLLSDIEVFSAA